MTQRNNILTQNKPTDLLAITDNVDDRFLEGKVDDIVSLCLRKCVHDYNEPALSVSQQVCLNRCTFKFRDAVKFGNEAINYYVYNINSQQQLPT